MIGLTYLSVCPPQPDLSIVDIGFRSFRSGGRSHDASDESVSLVEQKRKNAVEYYSAVSLRDGADIR